MRKTDRWDGLFLFAALLIGAALFAYYIHETETPTPAGFAAIGLFVLAIAKGRFVLDLARIYVARRDPPST